jgi:hypothetical protein
VNGVIDMVKLVQNIGAFPRLVELRPFRTLRGLLARRELWSLCTATASRTLESDSLLNGAFHLLNAL